MSDWQVYSQGWWWLGLNFYAQWHARRIAPLILAKHTKSFWLLRAGRKRGKTCQANAGPAADCRYIPPRLRCRSLLSGGPCSMSLLYIVSERIPLSVFSSLWKHDCSPSACYGLLPISQIVPILLLFCQRELVLRQTLKANLNCFRMKTNCQNNSKNNTKSQQLPIVQKSGMGAHQK